MSFLIPTLFTIAIILRPIACNYDCICHYDVEQAVYSAPDPVSAPLGFLYEFDCKAIDTAQSHPEWWTVFFEHRMGYVPTGDKIIEQTCSGQIPPDDILTTKQTPKPSGYQSTIFSTPKRSVSHTLDSKQTSIYSKTTGTKSGTTSSASTVSSSTKISTSRSLSSSSRSSPQNSVASTLYHQHTGSYSTSPRTKSYSTPTSLTFTTSQSIKISTSTPFLSTILSSHNVVTGTSYHQNIANSSIAPKTESHFTTISSTSSPRSATSSTSIHLVLTINSTSPTWNPLSSSKTNSSFVKSSVSSIRSSAQTMLETKTTSIQHLLVNTTTVSGTQAKITSKGTTNPSVLFNLTLGILPKTVITRSRTTIPLVPFNVTSILPTKTVVATRRTTMPLILSNVTSALPSKTVVAPSKTSIPSILFNVTCCLPTKTNVLTVSNRTTLPQIYSSESKRFSTKMAVTLNGTTFLTNLFNTTTSLRTRNTVKSSTPTMPMNHFNTTAGLSSKIKVPSKRTTFQSALFNTTTNQLSSKTRFTDNIHHTMFSSSTYVPAKNATTTLFSKMPSTTTRQSNTSVKINWTTSPTQTEASKSSIPTAITSSSMIDTSVQLNTLVSSNRAPTSSKQSHSITSEASYSTTSLRGGSSVTSTRTIYGTTPTVPPVIRSTTDKWSVEMCPYLMLSRNKYNGSLYHPYPLVRRVGQHCYEFNAKLDNWYSARSVCRQKGGDLAVLDSETTEIMLLSMLRELQFDGEVWIGLTDIDMEGIWMWVNGVRYRYEHWDSLSNGDPVYDIRRNCAVMNTVTGQWRKSVCRGFLLEMPRHYFICQYSLLKGWSA